VRKPNESGPSRTSPKRSRARLSELAGPAHGDGVRPQPLPWPAKDFTAELRQRSACPARAADGQHSSHVRVGKDLQRTMEDRDAERRVIPLLNWAFTTIDHDFLLSVLPRGPSGTDRGRQSANPRLTGGLVSHDQAKRSRASPDGIRDTPTGSKRAATPVAWPACRDLPELGSHLRKLTLASASIGRLPARQVVSVGRQDADAAGLPLDLVDPALAVPRNQAPSPASRRPEAAAAA
jgi:hypothetical protein